MVETKIVNGGLHCNNDDGEEYEKWKLYGKVDWNGVEADVFAYLEDIFSDFEGLQVEITIKHIEA